MSATAYPIPDAALDDRLGWIGTAGSGKTYNAGAGVERLLESGARVDMAAGGGSFGTYLSRLASPGLILREGGVIQLSPGVMGE